MTGAIPGLMVTSPSSGKDAIAVSETILTFKKFLYHVKYVASFGKAKRLLSDVT